MEEILTESWNKNDRRYNAKAQLLWWVENLTERWNYDNCPEDATEEEMKENGYIDRESRDGIIMWYIDWTAAGKAAKEDIQNFVDPPSTYIRHKRPKPDPEPKPNPPIVKSEE